MTNQNPTGAPAILSAQTVSKSYQMGSRRVDVLREISLVVGAGEFVAIQGASGAGKSTLLHLLGGLDSPDKGGIELMGQSLALLGSADLARFRNARVGLVFQAYHLFPEFSALENVELPARMARKNPAQVRTRATMLLERVGLSHRLDHHPNELSGGEQQRVAIARALINSPAILLADEPTGNLDSKTGEEIIQLIESLQRDHQTTLLIATHDSRVAARAERIVELVDGRLAA